MLRLIEMKMWENPEVDLIECEKMVRSQLEIIGLTMVFERLQSSESAKS